MAVQTYSVIFSDVVFSDFEGTGIACHRCNCRQYASISMTSRGKVRMVSSSHRFETLGTHSFLVCRMVVILACKFGIWRWCHLMPFCQDGDEEEELDRFERAMRAHERTLEKRLAWATSLGLLSNCGDLGLQSVDIPLIHVDPSDRSPGHLTPRSTAMLVYHAWQLAFAVLVQSLGLHLHCTWSRSYSVFLDEVVSWWTSWVFWCRCVNLDSSWVCVGDSVSEHLDLSQLSVDPTQKGLEVCQKMSEDLFLPSRPLSLAVSFHSQLDTIRSNTGCIFAVLGEIDRSSDSKPNRSRGTRGMYPDFSRGHVSHGPGRARAVEVQEGSCSTGARAGGKLFDDGHSGCDLVALFFCRKGQINWTPKQGELFQGTTQQKRFIFLASVHPRYLRLPMWSQLKQPLPQMVCEKRVLLVEVYSLTQ